MTEALGPKGSTIRIEIPGGELVNARIVNAVTGEELDNVTAFRIEGDINSDLAQAEVWLKLVNVDIAIEAVLQDYEIVKAAVSEQADIYQAALDATSETVREERRAAHEREAQYFRQSLVERAQRHAEELSEIMPSPGDYYVEQDEKTKVEEQLKRLEALHDRGVLSLDEFESKRAQIRDFYDSEEGRGC